MKDIFSQINKLKRNEKEISKKEITEQLIKVSNRLKSIFEKRLNYRYSVSIKVIVEESSTINGNSVVQTIIRDEESYFERKDHVKNGTIHLIKDNTCFEEVIQNIEYPNKSIFVSNDLVFLQGYKNSSFQDYGVIPREIENSEKEKFWTLPYKSEIIVPISPLSHTSNSRKNQFYGYLCVDCNEKDGFHKKYDVHNLVGIADGISDLLSIWLNLKLKENHE